MQQYKFVRVLVHPGQEQWHVAVVARSVSGRSSVDRILWRGVVDDPGARSTVSALLLACGEVLAEAACRMDQ